MNNLAYSPLLLLFLPLASAAQPTLPTFPQKDTYRTAANSYYWKNRPPHPGYWQQDVQYIMAADIDEVTDIIHAQSQITYWNNSPDTLHFAFFHLYQNAFVKGSYTEQLHKANGFPVKQGKYERQGLGTEIIELTLNNGYIPKTELDNTILKVYFDKPLLPNDSVQFNLRFRTYFDAGGNIRRRMKMFNAYGYKHYDGVHWYPRLAVYDRKFGWCTDQHLTREFYGNFGSYLVKLRFSSDFVVEATGRLINESQAMPPSLRQALDIKQFANKLRGEKPSVIIPYNRNDRKEWIFQAENVHDFAFTADPTYRIGEVEWNGIKIVSLAQEPHAAGWQYAAEFTRKVIQTYSRDFGPYIYPKMVVADARDGMEYPMITLNGGWDPQHRGLLAHEVGHNWFFGIIGSNETYRAALDEGFTQFLTAWALISIDGKYEAANPAPTAWERKYLDPEDARFSNAYYAYLRDAIQASEVTLNTHSDDFGGRLRHGGGYGQVYYKTATMLYNLQYVLGDSLFQNAMRHYYRQWMVAHPYWEDFKASIIGYTKVDLNWFFDQWFDTYKTLDYSVGRIKQMKGDTFRISFKRKSDMQMPIDFTVWSRDGSVKNYHIPNHWFVKATQAEVLPRWIGWGQRLQPEYHAYVVAPGGVEKVQIDTTLRLADKNLLNNSNRLPVQLRFDSQVDNFPSWTHYDVLARPDVWYNAFDGAKVGIHLNGNYMKLLHHTEASFWINTGLGARGYLYGTDNTLFNPISYNVRYETLTHSLIKGSSFEVNSRWLDGLHLQSLLLRWRNRNEKNSVILQFKSLYRARERELNYLLFREQWNPNSWNNTVNIGFTHDYQYRRGQGQIRAHLRSSALFSDYDYAQLSVSAVNSNRLGRFNLRTRWMAMYGTGSRLAPESALFLAGANPEEMMESKFYRSQAFFPDEWAGYGANITPLHMGGGLNIRGYAGYLAPEIASDGSIYLAYTGNGGSSVNAELEFQSLFRRFQPRITRRWLSAATYLFGDAGVINRSLSGREIDLSALRVSAGLGTAFTVKSWGPLAKVRPLTIRFDMPLFINRTPDVSPDFVQFRYIVGINRAF